MRRMRFILLYRVHLFAPRTELRDERETLSILKLKDVLVRSEPHSLSKLIQRRIIKLSLIGFARTKKRHAVQEVHNLGNGSIICRGREVRHELYRVVITAVRREIRWRLQLPAYPLARKFYKLFTIFDILGMLVARCLTFDVFPTGNLAK